MCEEQIYVHDLSERKSFKTSIDNIALKRHFYTLGRHQAQPSYVIEEALSKLESDVKPLLNELVETESLFKESSKRTLFSVFLATLLMRSRQGFQVIYGFREEVRSELENANSQLPSDLIHELLALDAEGMRELFAKSVIAIAGPLSKYIQAMHWRLLRAEEDYFITSENPFVIYNHANERWGLMTPESHIHVAISPRLLLHLCKEPTIPGQGTVSLFKESVKGANGLTMLGAEKYVLSHTSFETLEELLADRAVGVKREFGPAE